jgi:uncharacterized BrkB/YihY/UPF0761 family membrane protein
MKFLAAAIALIALFATMTVWTVFLLIGSNSVTDDWGNWIILGVAVSTLLYYLCAMLVYSRVPGPKGESKLANFGMAVITGIILTIPGIVFIPVISLIFRTMSSTWRW